MNSERQNLIIKDKWEKIIKHIQANVFPNMPTPHRDTIGKKLMNELWDAEEILIRIEMGKDNRKELLRNLDVKKDMIMVMVRICYSLSIINVKLYEYISQAIIEVGRMIGGLSKSTKYNKFSGQGLSANTPVQVEAQAKAEESCPDTNCADTDKESGQGSEAV